MTDPEGIRPRRFLEAVNIEEMFFPTPRKRIENPTPTELLPGDLVEIQVGPATGKIGVVVVERNGNYADKQSSSNDESIGVQTVRDAHIDPIFKVMLQESGTIAPGAILEPETRWFDDTSQLQLLYREPVEE